MGLGSRMRGGKCQQVPRQAGQGRQGPDRGAQKQLACIICHRAQTMYMIITLSFLLSYFLLCNPSKLVFRKVRPRDGVLLTCCLALSRR